MSYVRLKTLPTSNFQNLGSDRYIEAFFGPSLSFTAACAAHLRHYNRACGSYFNIALQDITLSQVGNNKTEVKHSRARPLWLCPSKGHRRRGLCNCRVQAT